MTLLLAALSLEQMYQTILISEIWLLTDISDNYKCVILTVDESHYFELSKHTDTIRNMYVTDCTMQQALHLVMVSTPQSLHMNNHILL